MNQNFFVCRSCLKDLGLIDFFDFEYGTACSTGENIRDSCNFCPKVNVPLLRARTMIKHIEHFIKEGHSLCIESAPYSGKDGGYMSMGYSLVELFDDYREGVKIGSTKFELYINSILSDDEEPYQIGDHFTAATRLDVSRWSWENFCKCIKDDKKVPSSKFYADAECDSPDVFLEYRLPTYLTRCDCIKTQRKGTIIYRGRKTDNILPEPLPFEQITSPSLEYIKGQNRFSCNKVSMFYGAKDEETAKKEIDYQNEPNLYIGRFSLLHKITILDLSQIKSPKGLFDKDWQGEYFILKFMNSFLKEIRKPVEDQTIDYKPTQSISDYIRNNEIYGHKVDGIKYKSSKNGKICYVFFWGAEDSAEHLKLKDYTHSRK